MLVAWFSLPVQSLRDREAHDVVTFATKWLHASN
jgi:hypothetical protein